MLVKQQCKPLNN